MKNDGAADNCAGVLLEALKIRQDVTRRLEEKTCGGIR